MIPLMKLDLWLLRWAILFIVLFAPISGAFLYTGFSVTGVLVVFVTILTLTQMDEKQKTRRFMLSLPLPLKTFFQARALVVILIGVAWIIPELFGKIIGFGDDTFGEFLMQAITQFATMIVLTPILIAILTLIHKPILKWGLTFMFYIVTVMIGTFFGAIIASFTYLGAAAYILSIVFLIVAVFVSWLILWIANRLRARKDLV